MGPNQLSNQSKEFKPEVVLPVVARELQYSVDALKIADTLLLAPYEDRVGKLVAYKVESGNSPLSVMAYRNQEAVELAFRKVIGMWVAKGIFLDEVEISKEIAEAVGRAYNPRDFDPWITVRVRESAFKTTKDDQAKRLGIFLRDPVAAVLELNNYDPEDAMTVFLEQGQLEESALTAAILRACGGWKELSFCEIVGYSDEGFIIDADNEYTAGYLRRLNELRKQDRK